MIYLLRRADGMIKIGTTTGYSSRHATLTRQYGPLELLCAIEGDKADEQRIHGELAESRQRPRAEWFRYTDEVKQFIADHADRWVSPASLYTMNVQVSDEVREMFGLLKERYGAASLSDAAARFVREHREDIYEQGVERAEELVDLWRRKDALK